MVEVTGGKARSSATAETARIRHRSVVFTVKKTFRYVEPFKGVRINYRQC